MATTRKSFIGTVLTSLTNEEAPLDDGSSSEFSEPERLEELSGIPSNASLSEKIEIANNESKQVSYMRHLLMLVLVLVAAGVSTAVFLSSRESEQNDFETQYYYYAHKLTSSFRTSANMRLGAIESFAVSIASSAQSRGEAWPNVTTPDFERKAEYIIKLSSVISLTILPLVTTENRDGWGEYSGKSTDWIKQGLAYQEQRMNEDFDFEKDEAAVAYVDLVMEGPLNDDQWLRPYTFNLGREGISPAEEGPFFPWWQFAPVSTVLSGINYNTMSHPTRAPSLKTIMETKKPLVTAAWDYANVEDPRTKGKQAMLDLYLLRWQNGGKKYEDGPVSDLYYPIFEAYENADYMELSHTERKLVAVINSYVYWQVYFEDVLPDSENAHGVTAILENTCGQAFTYVINGASASYIGAGDLHDPKYDAYVVSTGSGAFLGHAGAGYEEAECTYEVHVYPAQELEDSFRTKTPVIFTVVVACTFLFTSLVFFVYDLMVERRQHTVMKKAVKSTEVVNTLFPAAVRDRLFDEESKNKSDLFVAESASSHDAPIVADLYENCTVLFADLAGFTKWSSTREPKHVFELLEAIYGEFDAVSKRRRVFKVETIGDCYLAITGVPRAQPKHALIMARFASEAMQRMNQIIHLKLVNSLGEETAKLSMRVGLHSGSVTAGVLRGERARFQLFGDVVNTASRMESTGLPGRIQASKSTADLLVAAGKGAWVKEREGGVEAKGKGTMQTFWIDPSIDKTATDSFVSDQSCPEHSEEHKT